MLFKINFTKLDSLEEAENYIKGSARPTKIPKMFRDPDNTDAEIKKIEAKKRRSNKKELNSFKAESQAINVEYLLKGIELHPSSTSILNKMHTEHAVTSAQERSIHKEKVCLDCKIMPVMITYCLSFVNICFTDNYFLTQKSINKILKTD